MALILGIESTCDETAAAVVVDGRRVLSSVVASQVEIHARFRGVVPEIASRAHLENILPVLEEGLRNAGVRLDQIDAVAVTHRPGLIGSLLIGVTAAKTLAWATGKPLVGVDHVQAHLYSVMLEDDGLQSAIPSQPATGGSRGLAQPAIRDPQSAIPAPAIGLVASGGHTALYRLGSFTDVALIGRTIDDAVGEAYDKVSAILGLGYPGGPVIDRLAAEGDPAAVRFPRTMLGRQSLDFSFSGLKTAVLYHVRGYQGKERSAESLGPQQVRDVAASFQAACIDVLIAKLGRAIRAHRARCAIVGGGVSANRGLRAALAKLDVPTLVPSPRFCTDNAAMSAGLGDLLLSIGRTATLDLDAVTHSEMARA